MAYDIKDNGFMDALGFVLEMEGSDSNDPDDPGGLTRFGICQRSHPKVDVASLTREQAVDIYRKEYWDACRCNDLPAPIAMVVFDEAVNQGVYAAIRDLQEVLGVKVDGVIGPVTLGVATASRWVGVVERLTEYRAARYGVNLAQSPWLQKFARGWMRRAFACMDRAREITRGAA